MRTPDRYIDLVTAGEPTEAAGETLDPPTRAFEKLELELRMRDGVARDAFSGADAVELVEAGLLVGRGDRWVLTRAGRLLQNEISLKLRS